MRSCRKARNGAMPVPGPIMMIGIDGSAGRPKCVRLLHVDLDRGRRARRGRRERSRRRRAACARRSRSARRRRVSATRLGSTLRRRRDRIEPRLQRIERLDEGLRIGTHAGEFLDRRQHVERGGVAVRILAGGERLGLLPALAAGDVGEQLEQHVGRRRRATRRRSAPRASVRPPIGKSGGASSAAITASTSAGSLVGNRPKASPTA